MTRLREVILPFDPQYPEDAVPPSWRSRLSWVGLTFALGAVTGLGTAPDILHYVLFPVAALAAGLAVNHSGPGLAMILNMAPFRHGGERTGLWLRDMLFYTVGAVAATIALGAALGHLGSMLPRSWSAESYGLTALGVLAAVYALREPPVVSVSAPQWWTQLAEWRRGLFGRLLESGHFSALIGQVCGTFVPNTLVQIMTVAAVVYGSPAFGAFVFGVFVVQRVGTLWLIVSWRRTSADLDHAFELATAMTPRLRLIAGSLMAFVGAYSIVAWITSGG